MPIISILSISDGLFSTHKHTSQCVVLLFGVGCNCTFDILLSFCWGFCFRFFFLFDSIIINYWPILVAYVYSYRGPFQVLNRFFTAVVVLNMRWNAINIISRKWAFIYHNNKALFCACLAGAYQSKKSALELLIELFDTRSSYIDIIIHFHNFFVAISIVSILLLLRLLLLIFCNELVTSECMTLIDMNDVKKKQNNRNGHKEIKCNISIAMAHFNADRTKRRENKTIHLKNYAKLCSHTTFAYL